MLLQGARFGNWFAVVAAGGGCEMPMAVWALGPVGDHVYAVAAVAQKASAWLLPKNILLSGVYAGVILLKKTCATLGLTRGNAANTIEIYRN